MSSFIPKVPRTADTFALLLPGITSKSHNVCEDLLVKNHKAFHIFFNDHKFHNHFTHHLLAAYSLGATTECLHKIFDEHSSYQRKFPELLPVRFDRQNYHEYLGKSEAYANFLELFQKEIDKHGPIDTVRRWVYSGDMLARTIGGAFHPLIHIGYGLEFDVPGLIAEGLAMAACTTLDLHPLIDNLPPLEDKLQPISASGATPSALDQVTSNVTTKLDINASPKSNPLVDIVQEIQQDKDFDGVVKFEDEVKIRTVLQNRKATEKLKQYVARWPVTPNKDDLQLKLRELYEACVLTFGASAIRKEGIKLDFFLMHALTSVLFVHNFLPVLSAKEGKLLLQSHLSASLAFYVSRGRPTLQVDLLLNYQSPNAISDSINPWNEVFALALKAKEVHVIKTVRSCAVGQILYGHKGLSSPLENAWLKAAQLALDKDGDWNFDGIGFDEAWK
ncbi:hypothetical protein EC973_002755 [Apophysomyces ossiformis]|uniref:Oxidoreductase AflY n=1 Tax=Apophysomyces ossiformis TaxID=679940 RepID=A0A8H7BY20_9FUNG|nr:hypothetical protein EC973_002755 [Apophysomyces ossiformis]